MKNLSILFALFLSTAAFAQKFTTSVSEQMKYEGATPIKLGNDYFSLDADSKMQFGFTFKLKKIKYSIKLSKYSKDLTLVKELKLANGERVYGPFEPSLQKINNKLYLLYYEATAEDDQYKLSASEIEPAAFTLKPAVELQTIVQKNTSLQQSMDLMYSSNLVVAASPDKSRLLVLRGAGVTNHIFISVFDQDFKKIWSKEETVKGESSVTVTNAVVSNSGTVSISCKGHKDYYFLTSYEGKYTQEVIKLDGAKAFEVFVMPSATTATEVQLIGTYKEGSDWLAGVFSQQTIGGVPQLSALTKTTFPVPLIERLDNDGWGNKKPKKFGAAEFHCRPLLLADGTVDLVGEFRRHEMSPRASFEIAGDILNMHFRKDGVYYTRIPKERVSAGSTIGDSYGTFLLNDKVVIFYNDHEENLLQDVAESPKRSDNYRKSVLVAATINEDGTLQRKMLIDLSNENYLPIAEKLQTVSASSILVPVRRIKAFGNVADDFKWATITIQ